MRSRDTLALLALLQRDTSRWADIRVDLQKMSPTTILARDTPLTLMGDDFESAIENAGSQVKAWESDGLAVVSVFDEAYPSQLRSVHDYPPILFTRGASNSLDVRGVAVVGTRAPSAGALKFIEEVIPLIADNGNPVVSGLARGVDSAAMRASLASGNRTVGIIGTGLRRVYPPENRELQERIAQEHLLVSQFWPDAPPTKQSFPMRNHVMSAFSSMTLIVEAGENSGTRIQARAATKHARPVIVTRAVYVGTDWAKDLIRRKYDVTVVSTAAEALEAVRVIENRNALPPVWTERPLVAVSV